MGKRPPKLYLDTETCGLHSMMVLLQYAVGDGPIVLYEVWRRPIRETLALIEWICQHTVVGFNLSFDWFHVCKVYTIFRLCDPDWVPQEHIDEIALLEPRGQDGPCVKPAAALDLMLHSRKGPYQSLMAREDVRIKRVPTALAYALAREMEARVQFDNIYFAKSADPEAPKWQVFDRHDSFGDLDTQFKDVVLKFNPAGGLKFLAEHALKLKPKYHYSDVEPSPAWRPYELGYAPTALAVSSPEKGWAIETDGEGDKRVTRHAWPGVIRQFIDHWATRQDAREYATDDIVYTRELDKHFGYPEPGDNDSTLTCMVAAVRWHGFTIDRDGIKALMAKAQRVVAASPVNINKPSEVRAYVTAAMDDTEKVILEESTKKANLEAISKWGVGQMCPTCKGKGYRDKDTDICPQCKGVCYVGEPESCGRCEGDDPHCARCGGTGLLKVGRHPAGVRAKEMLGRTRGLEAKPCVQTFTFGQHCHHDLGNNHRPLLRLRWFDAPLRPDAIRVPSWRQENGDKRADPRGRVPGDVFDFTRVVGNSKQRRPWHPTQLNEGLVERCVRLTTPKGEPVLDPFAGTGTTLRVCRPLSYPCTLIEIDKGYCAKIVEEHGMKRSEHAHRALWECE